MLSWSWQRTQYLTQCSQTLIGVRPDACGRGVIHRHLADAEAQHGIAGHNERACGVVDVGDMGEGSGSPHPLCDHFGDALFDANHARPLPLDEMRMLRYERLSLRQKCFITGCEDADHEREDLSDEIVGRPGAEYIEFVVARQALVQADDRVFFRGVIVEERARRDVDPGANVGNRRSLWPALQREVDGSAMDGITRLSLLARPQTFRLSPLKFLHVGIIARSAILRELHAAAIGLLPYLPRSHDPQQCPSDDQDGRASQQPRKVAPTRGREAAVILARRA